MLQIPYGASALLQLDVPSERLVADCHYSSAVPLEDPAAAAAAAVESPLDFPSLKQAIVPGDHVTIAVGPDIPCVDAIVGGVLHVLRDGPVQPADVCVLCADEFTYARLVAGQQRRLGGGLASRVRIQRHEPDSRDELSFLGANRDSQPLYFNRSLLDADVVIPIGVLRPADSPDYAGVHSSLYPAFADRTAAAMERSSAAAGPRNRLALQQAAVEAAWMIGAQFTVQIVPGPGESVLQVLAGDSEAVERQGQRLCEEAWQHSIPDRADLVVATIEGGAEAQTWQNIARAVFAARRAAAEGADIVLCTEISCDPSAPSAALDRSKSRDREFEGDDFEHGADSEQDSEAVAMDPWGDAMRSLDASEHHVYLLSRLPEETVERLGAAFVAEPADVSRMSCRRQSCILLRNAHRAMVSVLTPSGS